MKSILLRGPVLTNSGYGVHARQIARWLFDKQYDLDLDISVELTNWGMTGWLTDVEALDGLVGQVLQATQNKKKIYDVTIQIQLPNEWEPSLGLFNIGVTAGVEADRCSLEWVRCVNNMNLVIVPSTFTRNTFLASGPVQTPIAVVAESYMDELKELKSKPINLDGLPTETNLLVFGQVTGNNPNNDRKNLPNTIKWLAEALKNRPDVGVVLKTNSSRNTRLDKSKCEQSFSRLVQEVKTGPGPNFFLLHGSMTNEELVGLYTHPKIKALVSFTRGEGYGLPLLEAAVAGLPIIATAWSGHMDFLSLGKFIPVNYTLDKVHPSRVDSIFEPEAKWANPIEEDAKKRVVKFLDSPSLPRTWAQETRKTLLAAYSFEAISQQYDNVLIPRLKEE